MERNPGFQMRQRCQWHIVLFAYSTWNQLREVGVLVFEQKVEQRTVSGVTPSF